MHNQGRAQAPLVFLLRWAPSPISLVACLTGVVLEYQGQKMDIGRVDSDALVMDFPTSQHGTQGPGDPSSVLREEHLSMSLLQSVGFSATLL